MPRIRTVKPEHWNDKQLATIPLQAHLLWIGTWNFSDDAGVFENDPFLIRSQIFPRRTDIRTEQVKEWLDQLVKARFIIPFTHNEVGYYITRTFKAHQRIDKPQPSKIPDSVIRVIFQEDSKIDIGTLSPYSSVSVEDSNSSGKEIGALSAPAIEQITSDDLKTEKPKGKNAAPQKKFVAPNQEQVKAYFLTISGWPEMECNTEAAKYVDHYISNGWVQKAGKPIKNWEAACRQWIRRKTEGAFSNSISKAQEPSANIRSPKLKPQLEKTAIEINFLYERYLEDKCTISSVEAVQYDYLKAKKMIVFPQELIDDIRARSIERIKEKNLIDDEATVNRFMKKYGVLEFFKQLRQQEKDCVFQIEKQNA